MKEIKRFLAAMRPFKGAVAWEMQIGPLVLQWGHAEPWKSSGVLGTPLHIWKDCCWKRWMQI